MDDTRSEPSMDHSSGRNELLTQNEYTVHVAYEAY